MELTLVGLQNSGKTTLVNVIAVQLLSVCLSVRPNARSMMTYVQNGDFSEDMIPTVGFNMRSVPLVFGLLFYVEF